MNRGNGGKYRCTFIKITGKLSVLADTGCSYHRNCLSCPFPMCILDMTREEKKEFRCHHAARPYHGMAAKILAPITAAALKERGQLSAFFIDIIYYSAVHPGAPALAFYPGHRRKLALLPPPWWRSRPDTALVINPLTDIKRS